MEYRKKTTKHRHIIIKLNKQKQKTNRKHLLVYYFSSFETILYYEYNLGLRFFFVQLMLNWPNLFKFMKQIKKTKKKNALKEK